MNRRLTLSLPRISVLDLNLQYESIRTEIRAAIDKVLDAQHFILGPEVEALEREMAEYCGTCYGVVVASGTDALTLAFAPPESVLAMRYWSHRSVSLRPPTG